MTPGQNELATEDQRRSESALAEARLLLDAGAREGASSRMYYAAFHAARAVLTLRGSHAKTHSGLITLFQRTFGPTPLLGRLLDLRGSADYAREPFTTTIEEIGHLVEETAAFVARSRLIVDGAQAAGADEPDPPPDQ
ncbi:MAG: HEPN domain-containing protein [Actinomycetota bacterium]|nr:HEPN domain-containing protein [Actinomycetota bacterium]